MSRRNDANQKQNYCWFAVRILYLGSVTVDLSVDRKLLGAVPIAHCPLPIACAFERLTHEKVVSRKPVWWAEEATTHLSSDFGESWRSVSVSLMILVSFRPMENPSPSKVIPNFTIFSRIYRKDPVTFIYTGWIINRWAPRRVPPIPFTGSSMWKSSSIGPLESLHWCVFFSLVNHCCDSLEPTSTYCGYLIVTKKRGKSWNFTFLSFRASILERFLLVELAVEFLTKPIPYY